METKNKIRAYVVRATESEKNRIAHAVYFYDTDSEIWATLGFKVTKAPTLDVGALRLVLEAANNEREYLDEVANHPNCDAHISVRKEYDSLCDAIAKLEALTR